MKKNPFLSLVIPTKNRSDLVEEVVAKLVDQAFDDFEIIIADNSDQAKQSSSLRNFDDPRIKYLRTGSFSMPENWEFSINQANGEYVTIVNDKTLYRKPALSVIAKTLADHKPQFLTWVIGGKQSDNYNFETISIQNVLNQDVIRHGLACRIDLYQRFAPRGTNSAIRRDLLQSLQVKYGALCRPFSPDYSLSTFVLEGCDSSIHLSEKLACIIPGAPSNTEEVKKAKHFYEGYYATLGLAEEDFLRHVPSGAALINNLLLNDILESLRTTRASMPGIDEKEYYLMLISDIIISNRQGIPFDDDLEKVFYSLTKKGIVFRAVLILFLIKRFISGWPKRTTRMQGNLSDFLFAFRIFTSFEILRRFKQLPV